MNCRRHREPRWRLLDNLASTLSSMRANPTPCAVLGGLGLLLCWLVITNSLPYALAPSFPDIAVSLNPNNPVALMVKADKVRQQVLNLSGSPEQTKSGETAAPSKPDTIAHLPEANSGSPVKPWDERDALSRELRRLAIRTIAADPLNAKAFRLLAEMTGMQDQVRILMGEAVKRSRRESLAQFWLLNDSAYQKNYRAAIDHADILLRTRPELSRYVLAYLGRIADDPGGRTLLIQELAKGPSWRSSFFALLPQNAKQPDTPLKIMMALKATAQPVADKELVPYLNALIAEDLFDHAYNVWLQFLPETERDSLGLITHAKFEHDPTGLPFDWQVARGVNAIAEFVALGPDERALHIAFGTGRAQFPEVSQTVLLAPGKYRLEGKLRGSVIGKRGLRWQLRCASGSRRVLGETDMLLGESNGWRMFSFETEVPQTEDCRGLTLRLFHDSRSASEEVISGEVWFTGLHLERVADPNVVRQ